jgi:hypothetical protein
MYGIQPCSASARVSDGVKDRAMLMRDRLSCFLFLKGAMWRSKRQKEAKMRMYRSSFSACSMILKSPIPYVRSAIVMQEGDVRF